MTLLEELTRSLDYDCEVKDIRQGVFHTAALTRGCGLAATLPRDALRQTPPLVSDPGALLDKTAEELAALAHSESLLEAAMGMATINSLLRIDESVMVERNAGDILLEKGTGRNVLVVGHFPFLPKIRKIAATLWVLENNPQPGDYGPERAGEFLPQADVVAFTGTTLTNHTFDALMALCSPNAFVLMLGDSVPFSPLLFEHGVDALCGSVVADADLALRCVSQGATFRQIRGLRRMTWFKDKC
jgi:uncharacterized protein (DUF4213/DUF364 family)